MVKKRIHYVVTAVPPGKQTRAMIVMPASKSHAKHVKDSMVDDNRIALARYKWGNPKVRKATKAEMERHGTRKGFFTGKKYRPRRQRKQVKHGGSR